MKQVCVQGLGFVGAAIAVALANAKDSAGTPFFKVTGVDLDNPTGQQRVNCLNEGVFPFPSNDHALQAATQRAVQIGNLKAGFDSSAYADADYIVVSVPFNLSGVTEGERAFAWDPFRAAIQHFSRVMKPECLVMVETTVPPGTCRNVIWPLMQKAFLERGIQSDPLLAHSYERVMPGDNYLHSITEFYRCYSGINDQSADQCRDFLEKIISTEKYPLTRLATLEASEIAKVLENSYRAVTIAFIEEWAAFAENLNVNLYEVIDAIRMRPTHSNMRQPGFGVGGYCLTKDPLFAQQAAKEIYDLNTMHFPFCELAVKTNQRMPKRCFEQLKNTIKRLENKRLLLLGVSYKSDVGDTRFSPSADFVTEAMHANMDVICHDPLVDYWEEMDLHLEKNLQNLNLDSFDIVVFAVPHTEYKKINFQDLLKNPKMFIFDACGFLSEKTLNEFRKRGHSVFVIGRGVLEAA